MALTVEGDRTTIDLVAPEGAATLETDAAARVLLLWGRRPADEWENTTTLSGDPVEQVRGLKERLGQDIVVTGSITLSHALIEAGLVNE